MWVRQKGHEGEGGLRKQCAVKVVTLTKSRRTSVFFFVREPSCDAVVANSGCMREPVMWSWSDRGWSGLCQSPLLTGDHALQKEPSSKQVFSRSSSPLGVLG